MLWTLKKLYRDIFMRNYKKLEKTHDFALYLESVRGYILPQEGLLIQ